jgi:hypothetical protein
MADYAFKKGFSQVRKDRTKLVRKRIMKALGILTPPAFYQRLNGVVEPKISQAKIIEAVFAKEGITEVWGEAENVPVE